MHIDLQFSLTPDDVHEYATSYSKASRGMKDPPARSILYRPVLLITAILIALAISYFTFNQPWIAKPVAPPPAPPPFGGNPMFEHLLDALPYALVIGIFCFFLIRMRFSKAGAQKMLEETPEMAEPHHFTLTDEGVTIRAQTSTVTAVWSHFTHFHETDHLFLLFISRSSAHILVKRAFASPADLDAFRSFALAHVGNKPIGFPVQPADPKTKGATAHVPSAEDRP